MIMQGVLGMPADHTLSSDLPAIVKQTSFSSGDAKADAVVELGDSHSHLPTDDLTPVKLVQVHTCGLGCMQTF